MAAFSVNQVRQLYVVNKNQSSEDALKTAGDIFIGNKLTTGDFYFQYVGAVGDIMRSDLIKIENITSITATKADDIAYKLKSQTVKLDPTINGGLPVGGQDYVLRLAFRQYVGMSDADQYFKYGEVHAVSNMTADAFYKEMALSIVTNMANEINPLVKVYAHSAATKSQGGFNAEGLIEVTTKFKYNKNKTDNSNPYYANSAVVTDIDSLVIVEVGQPWHLGTMQQGVVPFAVQPLFITSDGDSRLWGIVEGPVATKEVLPEGQLIADLEYFCMGERGDQYRNMGWPNVIHTKYLTDPTKKYDVINIHYFYQGDGISVQKSEKDIQIACLAESDHTVTDAVIAYLNTATGLNIPTLS